MTKQEKVQSILDIALKEVGTKEKPMGSKNVKYNNAYYGGRVNNPALAWCVVFIWWVFKEAGLSSLFYKSRKTASCETLYSFYKKAGQIVKTPKKGDIAFYDFNRNGRPDHVGIVYDVKANGAIVAIEGNTSLLNQTNGGAVAKKTRNKSVIMGYARPAYEGKAKESQHVTFIKAVQKACGAEIDGVAGKETLSKTITVSAKKNSRHAVVEPLQVYLNALGYDCGTEDGIAGVKFTAAVKKYQKANGCVVDGEITAKGKTWQKLLKLSY